MIYLEILGLIILIGSLIQFWHWYHATKLEIISKLEDKANEQLDSKFKIIDSLDQQISQKEEKINQELVAQEQAINSLVEAKRTALLDNLEYEINDWKQSSQEAANEEAKLYLSSVNQRKVAANAELTLLLSEISDYKVKRDAINQEILRQRAIEENLTFYTINLQNSLKNDIHFLNSIRPQLQKLDIFDKLIYDNYVKKPVDEMVKRVLGGANPSGIQKITRLKTGEIQIGKSVHVKDRWVQHCKSCYHCGTISHSILHTTMEQDGIENFTFELLEEVPKEKLTERERYWINFYDSKNYGLNEREG